MAIRFNIGCEYRAQSEGRVMLAEDQKACPPAFWFGWRARSVAAQWRCGVPRSASRFTDFRGFLLHCGI